MGFPGVSTEQQILDRVAQVSTAEEAIALSTTSWWEGIEPKAVALAQLKQSLLCMNFGDFAERVCAAIGRGVYTHEFIDRQKLIDEIEGLR